MDSKKTSWNYLIIAVLAMLLIASIISYGIDTNREVKEVVEDQYRERQLLLSKHISLGLEKYLNEKIFLLEIVVNHKVKDSHPSSFDYNSFLSDFETIYEYSEDYYALQFVDVDGTIVIGYPEKNTPIGYNLYDFNQSWAFEHVKESKDTYITGPRELQEGGIGTFVWVPVYVDDQFKGTIVGIIKIYDTTEKFLNDHDIAGDIYLIDSNGNIIYDSIYRDRVGLNYIEIVDDDNFGLRDILEDQLKGLDGTGIYISYFDSETNTYESKIVSYSTVNWGNHKWSLAVKNSYTDVDSLVGSVYEKQADFVVFTGSIILLIGLIVVLILSRWNHELEAEITKKTTALQKSNQELKDANERLKNLDKAKTDFISIVSHELRTPLAAIRTSSELLKDNACPSHIQNEMLELIIRNVDRQTRMVTDLLDVSRLDSDGMRFNKGKISINELIDLSVSEVSLLAKDKDISIDINIETNKKEIVSDKDRLTQVFVNLLTNAIKFTPIKGHIDIQVMSVNDTCIKVNIIDNGIGIPKDKIDTIFEKFYQVDHTSTRKVGGTGLGLSIARGIIEGLGGEIWVESEEKKGSKFTFTIPTS